MASERNINIYIFGTELKLHVRLSMQSLHIHFKWYKNLIFFEKNKQTNKQKQKQKQKQKKKKNRGMRLKLPSAPSTQHTYRCQVNTFFIVP